MNYRGKYLEALEKDCTELIVDAYHTAVIYEKYDINWYENDFSELLAGYVNENPCSLDKGITCKTEQKISSSFRNQSKGFADKLPRIDFVYSQIWGKQRFYCYMEAKRLKQNDNKLKKRYIKEGIDSYISKKYPMGLMLGYLVEGQVNITVNGINALLKKDNREKEVLKHKQQELLTTYYESNHSQIGVLKHLIFDFT